MKYKDAKNWKTGYKLSGILYMSSSCFKNADNTFLTQDEELDY